METNKDQSTKKVIHINSLDELTGAATRLLSDLRNDRIFAFYGKMGAGKTTFIKSLCEALGVQDEVTSPTFALINVYSLPGGTEVYHFDFYRINHLNEAMDLGYEEYFYSGNYCFLEWPEKIESLLPDNTLKIEITVNDEDDSRTLTIHR